MPVHIHEKSESLAPQIDVTFLQIFPSLSISFKKRKIRTEQILLESKLLIEVGSFTDLTVKMPELTEVLSNKPAEDAAEKNDSDTESGSDDSIPELEDTAGGGQTQVKNFILYHEVALSNFSSLFT